MPFTTYHQLVGPQGRAFRGYQGTRFDTPISTFNTRPAMMPAAEPADTVAEKEAAAAPSPLDAMKEMAKAEPAPPSQPSTPGSGSPAASAAPESNALEQSMMQDTMTDVGLDLGLGALANFGMASAIGAPTDVATKMGVGTAKPGVSTGFGLLGGPFTGALGAVADIATTGLDAADMRGRLGTQGIDMNDVDPSRMGSYSREMDLAQEEGFGAGATQAGITANYGNDAVAAGIKKEMDERSAFQKTLDRAKTFGGILGNPTSERVGTFDSGLRMHEDLATKAMRDPTLAPLLGGFTTDSRGNNRGVDTGLTAGRTGGINPGMEAALTGRSVGQSIADAYGLGGNANGGRGSGGGIGGSSSGFGGGTNPGAESAATGRGVGASIADAYGLGTDGRGNMGLDGMGPGGGMGNGFW